MDRADDRLELTDPAAYRARLAAALGGRKPLDALRATPAALHALVGPVSAAALRQRPFPGKWTPNEIVAHMLDAEWVFGYRTRTIVCDERPAIIGIDQDRWVDVQRHNDHEPIELLESFEALRRINLRFWATLDEGQLGRVGVHAERGEEPVGLMLTMLAGHDQVHLEQIGRYLEAIGG
jgi:hypothetical protein